jgi:hypothetical protein
VESTADDRSASRRWSNNSCSLAQNIIIIIIIIIIVLVNLALIHIDRYMSRRKPCHRVYIVIGWLVLCLQGYRVVCSSLQISYPNGKAQWPVPSNPLERLLAVIVHILSTGPTLLLGPTIRIPVIHDTLFVETNLINHGSRWPMYPADTPYPVSTI